MRARVEEILASLGDTIVAPDEDQIDRAEAVAIHAFRKLGKGQGIDGSTITTAILTIIMNWEFVMGKDAK